MTDEPTLDGDCGDCGPRTASCAALGSLPPAAQDGQVSYAIFRVARLHKMLARHLLRRAGLYPGQEMLMMHLWEAGPQRQIDLIRLLDSDAATMTRMVQRLEKAGFVRRAPCPDDRRAVMIEPTAASQALRREVEQVWADLERTTVGDLAAEEQAGALKLLAALEHNLSEAAAGLAADRCPSAAAS